MTPCSGLIARGRIRFRGETQQRACQYCHPCNSGAPAAIPHSRGTLLLSCTQASVAEFRRQTLALDEAR
jgi:hypothetical protein